ncbi:MAG: hypothetical protein KJO54_00175 [Gammaproteobacteria bacterium]|nr:hypothetical protein [Gammaproteobacteria bacterium]NNF62104.1 hypothetical protein [Gammaproteobacteria bacterium]NNM20488.1 hypothetical protein [Gammaproteobacteria bacterium]
MPAGRDNRFLSGVASGAASAALGGLMLLYVTARSDLVELRGLSGMHPPAWFSWLDENLGLALPLFVIILVLFMQTLAELRRRVLRHDSPDRIAQMDHMADIWTSLFFGVGVIWTAIGMRNALLHALGDPQATLQAGAFALLERMVDGGILVALSTTIVGGMGGYLMRVIKTITIGAELKRSYTRHGREDAQAIRDSLDAMNRHLEDLTEKPEA